MEYNLVSNIESCYIQLPALLYYSHWPSIIISLFFGIFVFFKSSKSFLGKILLAIAAIFSIWGLFSLITWTKFDSGIISFVWSFFEILSVLFFFLVLYFVYVFIDKKDIPEIAGNALSEENKRGIEESVVKTIKEYGETLRLLGEE